VSPGLRTSYCSTLLPGTGTDRIEYIMRVLQVKKVPFTSYDLASDEEAKKLWKRKAPLCEQSSNYFYFLIYSKVNRLIGLVWAGLAKQQLPGLLVGGVYPGGYDELCVPHELTTSRVMNLADSTPVVSLEPAKKP
jgi:hypothetical protein